MFLDGLRDSAKEIEGIKQGLLAAGTTTVRDLWPQLFTEPVEVVDADTPEAARALAEGAKEDFSGVTWLTPSAAQNGIAEYEVLMREVRNNEIAVTEPVGEGDGWL